ncbi:MAG: DUF1851 domain-containing protein [Caulobacteraceae bacterium]
MLEAFLKVYHPDLTLTSTASGDPLAQLQARYGGASFNGGLYRIVSAKDGETWKERISLAFPEYAENCTTFAYDWLGRAFALSTQHRVQEEPGVLLLEPGTGEVLEIPASLVAFHDDELVNEPESALATSFFRDWLDQGGEAPGYDQCIGHKRPLFLGGTDDVEGIALTDLDVYWSVMGQLIAKTHGLQPGTAIGRISITDAEPHVEPAHIHSKPAGLFSWLKPRPKR